MEKTPCQLMAEHVLDDRVQHYHFIASLDDKKDNIKYLDNYKGRKGFFVKKFLINDKFNLNRWRVTWEAIKHDVWDFIGKPLVLTPDKDHPPVSKQEDFRVGTIIDVGLDEINKIAWQISEVFDKKTQQMILDKKVRFGSPTVLMRSPSTREQRFAGTEQQEDILHRFTPAHDALVENPAYGESVDKIKTICTGDGPECALKLLTVSASTEYRSRYEAATDEEIRKITQVYLASDLGYVESDTPKQCDTCIWYRAKEGGRGECLQIKDKSVHGIKGCCDAWKESEMSYKSDVNGTNTDQLTIVPFVKAQIKKYFTAEQLSDIIGHIKQADSESCVSRKIKHVLGEHPNMEHDQAIAIAYSECGEKGSLTASLLDTAMKELLTELMPYAYNDAKKIESEIKKLEEKLHSQRTSF